jgi:hypothetical protein
MRHSCAAGARADWGCKLNKLGVREAPGSLMKTE